ncbi:MAG: peroxiredoxin [Bdellovibrionota bacterium]
MTKIFTSALSLLVLVSALAANPVEAETLKVGDAAPSFTAKTHEGKDFDLKSRSGKWTVLYFYPKANTPGCTTQACAFRDNIKKVRSQGAEVFGISTDNVKDQAAFHDEHHLNFDLLADSDAKVSNLYGTKMWGIKMSQRWTFVINPQLKIGAIEKDVDPVMDADRVAKTIEELKKL